MREPVVTDDGHIVLVDCSAELHLRLGMNGTGEPLEETSLIDGFVKAEGGGFAGLQQPQTREDMERANVAEGAVADRESRRSRGEVFL